MVTYALSLLSLRIAFAILLVVFILMVLYLIRRDSGTTG